MRPTAPHQSRLVTTELSAVCCSFGGLILVLTAGTKGSSGPQFLKNAACVSLCPVQLGIGTTPRIFDHRDPPSLHTLRR